MNLLIITASVVSVLSALALVSAWKGAVQGYEDEHGFHPGAEPVPVNALARSGGLGANRAAKRREATARIVNL